MYDYKLEDYSNEYRDLIERQTQITKNLEETQETIDQIDAKVAAAKEAWLQTEVNALVDPSKSGLVIKAHRAYREILKELEESDERIEIIKRAAQKIRQQIRAITGDAKANVIQAAKADHQKAVVKTIEIMRKLAKAQNEEEEISIALGKHVGQWTDNVAPTYRLINCQLGDENQFGTVMFRLMRELEKRGYKL